MAHTLNLKNEVELFQTFAAANVPNHHLPAVDPGRTRSSDLIRAIKRSGIGFSVSKML